MSAATQNLEMRQGTAAAQKSETRLPPVIVLNLYHSGLAIARDFAGSGIRVVGLSADKECFGNGTRYCEVRSAPNSQREPERLVAYLLSLKHELAGAVIFPTRDADVVMLDEHRDILSQYFRLAIPPTACLLSVLDKNALAAAALCAGLSVPRTVLIAGPRELAKVRDTVGFPCVVKPVSSLDWRRSENWELVGARKAFRAENFQQLQCEYSKVAAASPCVLAQEWVPGDTSSIVVMAGYVNAQSQPVAFFTARKLLQLPDDFGTGCIVASEPIAELHEPTLQLWKALHYHGMAEVEYKQDARTGEYKLIEINTRHWDQHRLAGASGINLSRIAYCDLVGNPAPAQHRQSTARATWIAEDVLAYHVLRSLYRRELSVRSLRRGLRAPRIYGIFSWRDPVPFVRQMITITKQLVVRKSKRHSGQQ